MRGATDHVRIGKNFVSSQLTETASIVNFVGILRNNIIFVSNAACLKCELLISKFKSQGLNDTVERVAATKNEVHLRRSNKFYSKAKEIIQLCNDRDDVAP